MMRIFRLGFSSKHLLSTASATACVAVAILLSGCQTNATLTYDFGDWMGSTPKAKSSTPTLSQGMNINDISNDELCALLMLDGDNLDVWEQEAIQRDLTCVYPVSQQMSQDRSEAITPLSPPTSDESTEFEDDTQATAARSQPADKTASKPASAHTTDDTDDAIKSSVSGDASATLCEGVRAKDFASVKKALSLGIKCN